MFCLLPRSSLRNGPHNRNLKLNSSQLSNRAPALPHMPEGSEAILLNSPVEMEGFLGEPDRKIKLSYTAISIET
jgi:hypothetical protein